MKALYHTEIFLPAAIRALTARTIAPRITRHAETAAAGDRYGKLTIPRTLTFSGANVVEAEVEAGRVVKLVVRLPYDATRDAVFAIGFDNGQSFIKTVWFNLKSDRHTTLNRSRYATC